MYTEDHTKDVYPTVTKQTTPVEPAWTVFWQIVDAKVRSDNFAGDDLKTLAACYYIAYLASGAEIAADGKYASVSKSIGPASKSVSLGHGTESANAWLDRYNALISNTGAAHGGGRIVRLPPPATGYRDSVTARHIRTWWRYGRI